MYNNLYKNLVVIGGNASGLAAASQARRMNPDLDITVLESGKYISYGSCSLPYFISGYIKKTDDLMAYPKSFFEQKRNIKILMGHKVVGMDPSKKELSVSVGQDQENKIIKYDKLIISSGGGTTVPDIPGIGSPNVFQFRNVEDAENLKNYIDSNNPKKAVVIGGGAIGMLLVEAFNQIGIKTTVVERKERIYNEFEYEISTILSRKAEMDGVDILTKTSITSVNAGSSLNTVTIEDESGKKELESDLVLIATGISANTDFLTDTSIELGINGAIKVDSKLQSSHMNIYASGDCATIKNIVTGKQDHIPTANNAVKTGRIAGENAAGGNKVFNGSVRTVVDKVLDLEIASTGIGSKEAVSLGYDAIKLIDGFSSHAGSVPGAKKIAIIIIVDTASRKLLGAQMIGGEGVGKRIDVFATALTAEMTVDDIYMLDLSYAPAVSTVWDPINKICGKAVLALDKHRV
jgi:NADPH-dependent 2,4-dienoyl-CoA reductase/sulfur reductase-like enzyme